MSISISFRYIGTIAVLGGALVAGNLTERRIPEKLAFPLEQIRQQIAGWTATADEVLPPPTLRALKATAYLVRDYQKGDQRLDLFIAFYAQQRAGESMHSPKHCLPGAGWEIWQLGSVRVPVDGRQIEINKYSIENAGTRRVMFYWYQSKGRVIASEYLGKVLLARDTLLTGHTAGSIVRVTLADTPGALNEGVAFASQVIPEVSRCLGRNP
jgi:EpsI family protein